jgi:hypothetical protein
LRFLQAIPLLDFTTSADERHNCQTPRSIPGLKLAMYGLPTIHCSWQTIAAIGNLQGSLEEMQKAIRLDPNRPSSYINLAMQVKQTSAAEGSYKLQKAISLDPKSPTPSVNAGQPGLWLSGLIPTLRWAQVIPY